MDIIEFQKDLQKGMSITNALQKHEINLKEAFHRLHYKVNINPPAGNKYRKQEPRKPPVRKCPTQYIQQYQNHYYLRKCIPVHQKGRRKHKTVQFGTYETLEDAILVREAMKEDGWHITHLDRICNELNVRRLH